MAMAGKTMQAVRYDGYGGGAAALKHVEIPVPSPKKDEVLLKVEAASVNPVDWKIQKGVMRPFMPSKFPFVPVSDVAGEVIEVGPGVQTFKAGDKVVSMLNVRTGGGLAEYAVAQLSRTVNRPPEVSAAEGAGLPIAASTALKALKLGGAKFDGASNATNVLVTAASGGVGTYAVQLAKLAGLHVTATCGARNVDFVKSLGADEVLDYKTPEGSSLKSPSGVKYDAVVHCTVGIGWSTFEPNLSANGKVIDITPSPGTIASSVLQKLTFAKKQVVPLSSPPLSLPSSVDVAGDTDIDGEAKEVDGRGGAVPDLQVLRAAVERRPLPPPHPREEVPADRRPRHRCPPRRGSHRLPLLLDMEGRLHQGPQHAPSVPPRQAEAPLCRRLLRGPPRPRFRR